MGHHSVILIFGLYSFMMWYGCVFTTKRMIQQLGFHRKHYPKGYIMPNRKIRRLFGLKKKEIPKWCHCELLMSFVYIALFLVSTLTYLLSDDKLFIAQLFIWIYCILIGADALHVVVCLFLYR